MVQCDTFSRSDSLKQYLQKLHQQTPAESTAMNALSRVHSNNVVHLVSTLSGFFRMEWVVEAGIVQSSNLGLREQKIKN